MKGIKDIVTEQQEDIVDLNDEVIEEVEVTPEPVEELSYEIPDKFKEKSLEDVIQSYTELEKEFGRKNNEVGELRKLTDQLLRQELIKKEPEERKKVDFDSLVDDPDTAISEAVANNPVLKEMQANWEKTQRGIQQEKFEVKHPDYMDVVQSDGFVKFIQESPIRTDLYQRANTGYDYQAADELLTLYKQLHSVAQKEATEIKQAKKEQVMKDAAVEKGSSGAVSAKKYRRSDLIRMRMEDPDRFAAMGEEIRLAYKEGRVK